MRKNYTNKTGFRGVQRVITAAGRVRFRAYIYEVDSCRANHKIHLGSFDRPEDASAAHEAARVKRDRDGNLYDYNSGCQKYRCG